jgi:hypothetical protein
VLIVKMGARLSEPTERGAWDSVEPGSERPGFADPWAVRPPEHAAPGLAAPTHQVAHSARAQARRRRITAMVTVAVVAVATVTIVVVVDGKSSPAGGYAAQLGPAGTSPSLQLPQLIGAQKLLTTGVPIWTYQPGLLPTSPKATFDTISGTYFDRAQGIGINVDGVYALGNAQHRGVFSVSPAALESLVTQQLYMTDAEQYPAGPDGGLLECGTYSTIPTCVWADQSTLGFVYYDGTPGSMASLAALSTTVRSAVEHN